MNYSFHQYRSRLATEQKFTNELAEVLIDGLRCIQTFYLDHEILNQITVDVTKNVLKLNHDNKAKIENS